MLRGLPFAVANRSGKIRFVRDDIDSAGRLRRHHGEAAAPVPRSRSISRGRRAVLRKPPFSRVAAARAFSGGHRALHGVAAGQFRIRAQSSAHRHRYAAGAIRSCSQRLLRRGAIRPAKRAPPARYCRGSIRKPPRRDLWIFSAAPRLFKMTATSSRREGSPWYALRGRTRSQNWKRRPAIGSTEVWKR